MFHFLGNYGKLQHIVSGLFVAALADVDSPSRLDSLDPGLLLRVNGLMRSGLPEGLLWPRRLILALDRLLFMASHDVCFERLVTLSHYSLLAPPEAKSGSKEDQIVDEHVFDCRSDVVWTCSEGVVDVVSSPLGVTCSAQMLCCVNSTRLEDVVAAVVIQSKRHFGKD
jgi:hypothetical protein